MSVEAGSPAPVQRHGEVVCWTDGSRDWRSAGIVTVGIDVGAVSAQCAVAADGELYAYASLCRGDEQDSAASIFRNIGRDTGLTLSDAHMVVGTGSERGSVDFAHKAITEIACHARGANYMGGERARTVLDLGGQDCKAIRCDDRGRVSDFLMNDKCAAGAGRSLEAIADLMQIPCGEIGARSLDVDVEPAALSAVCAAFSRNEALALLQAGWAKNRVAAACCLSMAERAVALAERIGVEEGFFITGGIAKNPGVVKRIERLLGIQALPSRFDAQIAGALGAALFAQTLVRKQGACRPLCAEG